jgi:hypothetical protein
VYSIQQYVIKFVSDLRQVGGFLRVLWFSVILLLPLFSSTRKTDRHDSWNIIESDIKHHNSNPNLAKYTYVNM